MSKIRLALADERECVLQGFAKLLSDEPNLEIVSATNVWQKTVDECEENQPGVILISLNSLEFDKVEGIRALHERVPMSNIVVIIDHVTTNDLIQAVAAGVRVFLSPLINVVNLVSAIRLAAEGQIVLSSQISAPILEVVKSICRRQADMILDVDNPVTSRERIVLSLIKRGLTNKQIAVSLGISEHTVKVHVRNIMDKLYAHTRQEAVNFAIQREVLHSVDLSL